MNDLVITVNDNRVVRVFTDNTKSGTLIDKQKMQDLVSRASRIGTSWPVLNAGSQLTSDKYFFEIQPGKTGTYEVKSWSTVRSLRGCADGQDETVPRHRRRRRGRRRGGSRRLPALEAQPRASSSPSRPCPTP